MQIKLAKSAGFCFGVKRAVDIAIKESTEREKLYSLGSIIHNQAVIDKLSKNGLITVDSVDEIEDNSCVIIRAHGVAQSIYQQLDDKCCTVIDATCPFVSKIHNIVKRQNQDGDDIIILGKADHPEVLGISGWCHDAKILQDEKNVLNFVQNDENDSRKKVTIVGQTTLNRENWNFSVNILKKLYTNAKIFDTICSATDERQEEARQLAFECDFVVVIGDKHSSNTQKLFEICSEICKSTVCVQNANELSDIIKEYKDIQKFSMIGITAGASTPACIIKEVISVMSETTMFEMNGNFEELLEQSLKTLNNGDKVTGVITQIGQTEIQVDLGVKQSGFISTDEFSDDPTYKVEDNYKVGDEIEAIVVRVNDADGFITLSKKRIDAARGWETVEAAKENKTVLEGVVVEENKGGVVAVTAGVRVFIPASQTGLAKDVPMSEIMKKKVSFYVTEINRQRRRVVGSVRAVLNEERKAQADKVWEGIEVGASYKGTVKSLTSYGAFVDIGGVDGMVHISELSWARVKHPSEVIAVGDEVEVYVLSADKETRKISLGHKKASENPWTMFTTNNQIDDVVTVKILKFMPFGAFAEIIPGVDGLIHISQIADRRIAKPEEALEIGQTVDVLITDIDMDKKKVSLSIRALLDGDTGAEEADAE